MSEAAQLAAGIEALGGPGLVACAVWIGAEGAPDCALAPEEARAMARAVPARRAEFAAGRHAAREAMQRLGQAAQPVPMRPDRSPHWPEGLRGSISHEAGLAVAALRLGGAAFGIDIAPAAPLDRDLHDEIAIPGELDQPVPGFDRGMIARLVFSAKEAAYKAQFPESGLVLGFEAMRVEITATGPAGGGLVARLARPAGPYGAGTAFRGGWRRIGARFAVLMQAPASAAEGCRPGFALRNTASRGRARMASRDGVS